MSKKQSIASFIEKLPMDGSVGDCESTLLMTNMDFMGGATTNSSKCANASVSACDESTNDLIDVLRLITAMGRNTSVFSLTSK